MDISNKYRIFVSYFSIPDGKMKNRIYLFKLKSYEL